MISMELQPAVHMQHLNHSHQTHHGDLSNVYQHQMTNIGSNGGDDKSKSELENQEMSRIV